MQLRLADPAAIPCKACGGPSPLFGVVDFGRSCIDGRRRVDEVTGTPVYYRRCRQCQLLFTDAFDDWSDADYEAHIYNDAYGVVDPDFAQVRPASNVELVKRLFGGSAAKLSVLDYGAGNGVFAEGLRSAGFKRADSYDPFTPKFAARPEGPYDLVTCFETLEHVPQPKPVMAELASLVAEDGLILVSTMVQPADVEAQGMNWWYIGPRNGHITLYTRPAMEGLWRDLGLNSGSFNDNLHVAFRAIPEFAGHLIKRG